VALTRIVVEKMLDVSREALCSVESITKPVKEPMYALNHRTHAGNMCRMIHALPIVIEKAGSPIIGLLARITLFVVVCVPLLTVFFLIEMRTRYSPGSPFFHVTHLRFTLLKS
jgi:hypothetical protein